MKAPFELPPSPPGLPAHLLARLFDSATTAYKFYWFLGLVDLVAAGAGPRIPFGDVVVSMLAAAWHPINRFRLSFGKFDRLAGAVRELLGARPDDLEGQTSVAELRGRLSGLLEAGDPLMLKNVREFTRYVPHRLLTPWIGSAALNADVRRRALDYSATCAPYRVDADAVHLNPAWIPYLRENAGLLRDFALWHLTRYVQARNPNVPNVPAKLVRQDRRGPLTAQRRFWSGLMGDGLEVRCIYTGRILSPGDFDLDHFIPWSFVSHDLLWNLLPCDPAVNSSKGDRLPDLDLHVADYALAQQRALRRHLDSGRRSKMLDDYWTIGQNPKELAAMEAGALTQAFRKAFAPLEGIARNMGFEEWRNDPLLRRGLVQG